MQYIISPITTYDEDEQLYYTKVGTVYMELHFIACGKTEDESRARALILIPASDTNT